jgi:hypothetical protein
VDHVGVGAWRMELPVTVMVLPAIVLAALSLRRSGACLLVLAFVTVATLPLPVLVSTAAAQETQAFAFVYLLGLAFLADELWRRPASPRPAPRGS